MGLSLEAATEVVNVNGQNLSVLEDFLQIEDKDVETLCRVIRRPGGVNAAGNQNQGMQVLAMAEANLKRMCYQLRHHTRVSRPVVWADITLLSVRALSAQAVSASLADRGLLVLGESAPLVHSEPAVLTLAITPSVTDGHGSNSELCIRGLHSLLGKILEQGYAASKVRAEAFIRDDVGLHGI